MAAAILARVEFANCLEKILCMTLLIVGGILWIVGGNRVDEGPAGVTKLLLGGGFDG